MKLGNDFAPRDAFPKGKERDKRGKGAAQGQKKKKKNCGKHQVCGEGWEKKRRGGWGSKKKKNNAGKELRGLFYASKNRFFKNQKKKAKRGGPTHRGCTSEGVRCPSKRNRPRGTRSVTMGGIGQLKGNAFRGGNKSMKGGVFRHKRTFLERKR